MSIRVLLVEDHTILRESLRALLAREPDIEIVADASDGFQALRLARILGPDVIVMDIGIPGMDGIETTRQLLTARASVRVLALSAHMERHFILRMLEAGASGYMDKSADTDELLFAIRAVAQNKTYIGAEIASKMADWVRDKGANQKIGCERLGNREREVLTLIAEGKTSEEIASRLHIAAGTVIAHRRNISRKLGLHSVAELTRFAIREGLTSS